MTRECSLLKRIHPSETRISSLITELLNTVATLCRAPMLVTDRKNLGERSECHTQLCSRNVL
jgi:hypothetical protein